MTNNTNTYINNIENIKKPTEEIKFIDLPTVKEISEKGLPAEFKKALLDPNARFNSDCEVRCSYENCPWNTDFRIEIFLEGNRRKWARRPNQATWLPGSWDYGAFTSHYLSRWDLWLRDIDHACRVIPLLKDDTVYTVNLWGSHCAEDSDFCNNALTLIRRAISHHEKGGEVKVRETLSSDISAGSRFVFKTGATIGAGFINPAAAMAIGASAWGAGQVGQELCDSERGKSFWNTVGGMGENAFLGGAEGGILGSLSGGLDAYAGGVLKENAFKKITGPIVENFVQHNAHKIAGRNYDSDCPVCKP